MASKKSYINNPMHQNFIMLLSGFLVVCLIIMSLVIYKDSSTNNQKYTDEQTAIMNVGANDDVYSIEMELRGTDLSTVDSEIPLIEKELNSK